MQKLYLELFATYVKTTSSTEHATEMDLLQQIFSTIVAVLVALFSVWAKEAWESHKRYVAMIEALRDEIKDNAQAAQRLDSQIEENLKSVCKDEAFLEPLKRFYVTAWTTIRSSGSLLRLGSSLRSDLEAIYEMCTGMNDFSQRIEQITFTPPTVSLKSIKNLREANLKLMQATLKGFCEKLETAANSLERIIDC